MAKADIGLIGLAVMGQNLVLNMADHGFTVAVYNRTVSKVDQFISTTAKDASVIGTHSLEELVAQLKRPRRVMLMIKAGNPVDSTIDQLVPLLEEGDIIIDGGNSNYKDSMRRTEYLEQKGVLFIGAGVSGGEEGARYGPSIMPGGSPASWPHIKPIFQSIAAKVGKDNIPCCDWVGKNGAGHFVKMVHNGIEYGDMQLICEAYHLMKEMAGMTSDEMSAVFSRWNQDKLNSYLIEITADILAYKDEDGSPLVNKILDTAGQKGTGRWTGISALEMGVPLSMIIESVQSRSLSALKDERVEASKFIQDTPVTFSGEKKAFLDDLFDAVYASKIISYTQGYMLMDTTAGEYGWDLNFGGIAMMWRGGCIIRSAFLDDIKVAFDSNPQPNSLLRDTYFEKEIQQSLAGWRKTMAHAVTHGIPVPAMASALSFYDGYRREWLPANLLQAQRDYFGAHTYERIDQPRGQFFHTNWTGEGGDVTSQTYNI